MPQVDTTEDDGTSERTPHALVILGIFLAFTIALTLRDVTRLRTFVAGDSGDSLLNMWIIRSVQHGLPQGWHTLWNAPIFHPATDTLAYSDTLLPVALLDWPLRLAFGDVLAFNIIYLGAWVLSAWWTYRLALRVVRDWRAAMIGALTYTFAAIRVVHQGHFQLVVGGALVPLVLLLLLRCLDSPSLWRGALLGIVFAALALTASYYGAMMGVGLVVLFLGWTATTTRDVVVSRARPLLVAAAVVAAVAGPFAFQYVRLERQPEFRRTFEPASAAHLSDFFATGPDSYALRHLPVIGPRSQPSSRGVENRLFPGFVASVFGALGLVVLVRERRKGWRVGRRRELWLTTGVGLACVILAFGDRTSILHHSIVLPFIVFRHVVPGFSGMRATARLAIGGQLALALLAAAGLDWTLRKSRRTAKTLVTIALACLVLLEAGMGLTFVRVPTAADDGGVAADLHALPPGTVLELPINSSASGAAWPYVEAPRQLESLRDGHPRVNGYSGFQPKNFDAIAAELDQFPSPGALTEVRILGVRYVVLRTRLVGALSPAVLTAQMGRDGVGVYSDASARRILDSLPKAAVKSIVKLPGGYVLELNP